MLIATTIKTLRAALCDIRKSGRTIGFVPTMGALHEGHISLARTLRHHCDIRVCSIFVNPTQFNDPKDYEAYTINLSKDRAMLEAEQVDILFAPTASEIYPKDFQSIISVSEVSRPFEGASRPGHFQGVATVVAILFNIVQPQVAIFGEKDFQQLRLIEQMVHDLKMDITILRGSLVRDVDGLALSSRNARLSMDGRQHALLLSRGLFAARNAFRAGERSSARLEEIIRTTILQMPNPEIDYIAIVDEATLQPLERPCENARALLAARVEGVRLLDTIGLSMAD